LKVRVLLLRGRTKITRSSWIRIWLVELLRADSSNIYTQFLYFLIFIKSSECILVFFSLKPLFRLDNILSPSCVHLLYSWFNSLKLFTSFMTLYLIYFVSLFLPLFFNLFFIIQLSFSASFLIPHPYFFYRFWHLKIGIFEDVLSFYSSFRFCTALLLTPALYSRTKWVRRTSAPSSSLPQITSKELFKMKVNRLFSRYIFKSIKSVSQNCQMIYRKKSLICISGHSLSSQPP